MNGFYVYLILDPRKPGIFRFGRLAFKYEPIYVGKGKGGRAWETHHRNSFLSNKLRKTESPIIVKIKEGLTEKEAFKEEKRLIFLMGRHDLGKGPLTNLSDGGEGFAGLIRTKEHCRKISEATKGRAGSQKGRHFTEEHKRKISESNKKKKNLTEEAREKIREASRRRKGVFNHSKETRIKMSEIAKRNGHKPPAFIFTDEIRKKISDSKKGQCITEEQKRKISETLKGHPPNKTSFKKGMVPWNKGLKKEGPVFQF